MVKRIAQGSVMAVQNNLRYQLILLAGIILLAIAFRFYMLGVWGFWEDELSTVRSSQAVLDAHFLHRPPSLLAIYLVFSQLGVSEWSARLAPALIGVVTIPVFFWLVRKVTDVHVALLASVLLAIAPWHIYWSQNARFYTALLLFYTVALFLAYLAIEEDKPWYIVLSTCFLALALSERLIAVFLVPVVAGYMAALMVGPFEKPPGLRWRNAIIFLGLSLVAILPMVLVNPSVQDLEQGQSSFGFVNNSPFWILGGAIFYLGIPLVCMAAVGAFTLLLRKDRLGVLLSFAAAVPVLGILSVSLVLYSANRYIFVALTSFVLLAAIALRDLLATSNNSARLLAAGAALILLLAPMQDNLLYYRYQHGNRDNWKAAYQYISDHWQEGDRVMSTNRWVADYYMGRPTAGMRYLEQVGLDDVLAEPGRIWIVLDTTAVYNSPTLSEWTQANAEYVTNFDVYFSARRFAMEIYVYESTGSETDLSMVNKRQ